MKKYQQKDGHPSVGFPHFHIQSIMSQLQKWLLSPLTSTFPHGIFFICRKIPPGGWTSQCRYSKFLHQIYHVAPTAVVDVTLTFHVSPWNFSSLLKDSTGRMDILVWIFHISTASLSCPLYTNGDDL